MMTTITELPLEHRLKQKLNTGGIRMTIVCLNGSLNPASTTKKLLEQVDITKKK